MRRGGRGLPPLPIASSVIGPTPPEEGATTRRGSSRAITPRRTRARPRAATATTPASSAPAARRALGGRHIDPHGPGFDPDRLIKRNPQVCTACHGTNIPTR